MAKRVRDGEKDVPEHVTVFSDEWQDRCDGRGHHHEDKPGFGIVLIGAGILLFLNTSNVLPWTVWDHIWRFWPLLLILMGINALFGVSRLTRWLGDLIGLALVLLVGLFAVHQVNPALLSGLPPVFDRIFLLMKGLQR